MDYRFLYLLVEIKFVFFCLYLVHFTLSVRDVSKKNVAIDAISSTHE